MEADPFAKTSDNGRMLAKRVNELLLDRKDSIRSKTGVNAFFENYPIRHQMPSTHRVFKAAIVNKKTDRRGDRGIISKCVSKLCCSWQPRLVVLTSDGIGYANHADDHALQDCMFLDRSLRVKSRYHLGAKENKLALWFTSSSRKRLKFRISNPVEAFAWLNGLTQAIEASSYCRLNRHVSFAPVQVESFAKWYANGRYYFEDVAEAFGNAKRTIFITAARLWPLIDLPADEDGLGQKKDYRLACLLKSRAKAGVRIMILLNKGLEPEFASHSKHVKESLEKLHSNIKVIRHRAAVSMLWCHNEKVLVVDDSVCFIGSLDLCERSIISSEYWFVAKDESPAKSSDGFQSKVKDLIESPGLTKSSVNERDHQTNAMRRDIAIQLRGQVVKDVARHFVQYWNFAVACHNNRAITKSQSRHPLNKVANSQSSYTKFCSFAPATIDSDDECSEPQKDSSELSQEDRFQFLMKPVKGGKSSPNDGRSYGSQGLADFDIVKIDRIRRNDADIRRKQLDWQVNQLVKIEDTPVEPKEPKISVSDRFSRRARFGMSEDVSIPSDGDSLRDLKPLFRKHLDELAEFPKPKKLQVKAKMPHDVLACLKANLTEALAQEE